MTVATFTQSDYTTQSGTAYPLNIDGDIAVLAGAAAQFAPHAAATPNMTVLVDAGQVFNGTSATTVTQQTTPAFTAPASGQVRIDRVVLSATTGVLAVVAGTPVPSGPVPPAIPPGCAPCAQVALSASTSAITNALITDERALSALGLGSAAYSPIGTSGDAVPLLNSANDWSGAQSFLDQGVVVGAPTGGNQGAGSLNAESLAVNGVAVGVRKSGVRISCAAAQALTGGIGTYQQIAFDTVDFDGDGLANLGTHRITIQRAGLYLAMANITIQASSVIYLQSALFRNGTLEILGSQTYTQSTADNNGSSNLSALVSCALGDTLDVRFLAGASATLFGGKTDNYCSVLGPF